MKIGINGLGRIGRLTLRKALEQGLQIAALNTSANACDLAHLIKYDSSHGQACFDINIVDGNLVINNQIIKVVNFPNPWQIPWAELNVNLVVECSGKLNSKELAEQHTGVDHIIVSAPCQMADATIICGVNEDILHKNMRIISVGSCTTNALAPVVKILHQHFSIQAGYATTVHSYTFDQNLLDNFHSDIRRARTATTSMIPTKSGVSSALELVLPEIANRITGSAIRVPVPNVSLVDFSFSCAKDTNIDSINQVISDASKMKPDFLQIAQAKLVSIDYNHNSASAIFDPFETQVINQNFARVLIWYDNEWGFVSRMIDVIKIITRF